MPRFEIVTTAGEQLGPMEFTATEWPPGSLIFDGPRVLRVVEMVVSDDPDKLTVLVVEE